MFGGAGGEPLACYETPIAVILTMGPAIGFGGIAAGVTIGPTGVLGH
jgi:hypothetical protein